MADILTARVALPQSGATRDPLVPFGLEFIDAVTGGLIRDKLYLLYGPLAAWKTSLALYFVYESLRVDQRALYVTSQDPEAVILQADRLGFNLRPALQEERLTLLSYQPRISQQLALLSDYQLVMTELKMLAGPGALDRIVFDPIEVLISQENRTNVLPATKLLLEALKGLNTTLLCLLDETEEPHVQVMLKELLFQSFGAFHVSIEPPDDTRVFHFRKVIWNPREYPRIPITLRGRQGVQVVETLEAPEAEPPRLQLAQDPRELEPAPPRELARPLQALLVDNDDIYAEMLQDFLTTRYKVEQVRDSVEAISRLLEHSYDVILVNTNMPRVDGREVCLRIRQYQNTVPLIAYSNKLKRGSDVAGLLRIGADMFITRPFAFNQVKATIEAVLRRPAGPATFNRAKDLIREILEEERALRNLPRMDGGSGFNAVEFFERKVRKEIDKARVGDYSFALVAYAVQPKDASIDIDRVAAEVFRPIIRNEDMVLRSATGLYLVYLDECLPPGVKRFNDRLRKSLAQALGGGGFTFQYQVATFPGDARSYDDLVDVALRPLEDAHRSAPKRVP